MTTTNPTRRPSRGTAGRRAQEVSDQDGRSPVGERLRDARELRGVDLYRVERDTKIRSKYLVALEEGEYSDLPGDVYARGFLRNYATYLGLDADEIEEEWRQEAGDAKPIRPVIVGPQPLTMRRRVVFQTSHGVIAVVVVIILIVTAFFGYQLTRYLSYPTLSVGSAGASPVTLPPGTTTYVLTGTATPGTTILIAWNGEDPKPVYPDDLGHWTFQAVLSSGRNQFDITAKNLDTSHTSTTTRLIVIVPTPTPTPVVPDVAFSAPADGASVTAAAVTVTGTTIEVTSVTVTPTYLGPPLAPGATMPPPTAPAAVASRTPVISPGASAGPSGTPGPKPASTKTGADGTFSATLQLTPGRWQLTIVGTDANGDPTKAISRSINVPYKGVNVVIDVRGGDAWMIYFKDGVAVDSNTFSDGFETTVVGTKTVCVYVGKPGYVYVTVNGVSYGSVGGFGGSRVYIDASGPRNVSSC